MTIHRLDTSTATGRGTATRPTPYRRALPTPTTRVDAALFRRAFRRHPAGVVVISADAGRGPVGFTATSLSSLSAEPALVSFGISATSSSWPHLKLADSAVVHFLGGGHENIAQTFATSGIDRFAAPLRWRPLPTGEPLLDDAPGWLRIALEQRIPAGDAHLVVGRVLEAQLAEDTEPLLYHDGAYRAF